MTSDPRPLSPHLQIYRWQLTSVLSILHRVAGLALAAGAVLLVWWLGAAADGPQAYATIQGFLGSWAGRILLFGWSVALFYHLCNGLRHLWWDSGHGLELEERLCRRLGGRRGDDPFDPDRVERRRFDGEPMMVTPPLRTPMRSPLGRAIGLGSAKEGVGHWWAQRVSALALVPLALWFVVSVVELAGASRAAVVAWVRQPLPAVLLVLLVVATFYHGALGLQVIIEDYVENETMRFGLLIVMRLLAILFVARGILAVIKLSLGA